MVQDWYGDSTIIRVTDAFHLIALPPEHWVQWTECLFPQIYIIEIPTLLI